MLRDLKGSLASLCISELLIMRVPPLCNVILKFSASIISIEPLEDSILSQNSIVKLLLSLNFSIRFEVNAALIPWEALTEYEG